MEWHYLEDAWLAIKVEETEWGIPKFSTYEIRAWDEGGEHELEHHYLFSGSVSINGCSNWEFGDGYLVHFCRKEQMRRLGTALEWCYDYAKTHIEDFYGDD